MRGSDNYRQAWGLRPYQQNKLPNVGSASLPPAEAEDVEFNQTHPLSDQPNRPIIAAFFSFKNLFSELTPESLTILNLPGDQPHIDSSYTIDLLQADANPSTHHSDGISTILHWIHLSCMIRLIKGVAEPVRVNASIPRIGCMCCLLWCSWSLCGWSPGRF